MVDEISDFASERFNGKEERRDFLCLSSLSMIPARGINRWISASIATIQAQRATCPTESTTILPKSRIFSESPSIQ